MSRPSIPAANIDSPGELGEYRTPSPVNVFSSFAVNAWDAASKGTKILGESENSLISGANKLLGASQDLSNKLLNPTGNPVSFGIPEPTLSTSTINDIESKNPGLHIPETTPAWTLPMLVGEHQSKLRNEQLIQNADPGKIMSLVSDAAGMAGSSLDPESLLFAEVGGKLASKAVESVGAKLMNFHMVQKMFGADTASTGSMIAKSVAKVAAHGAGVGGGFQAGAETTQYLSDPEEAKIKGEKLVDGLHRVLSAAGWGSLLGAAGGTIGYLTEKSLGSIPGVTKKETESLQNNFEHYTNDSVNLSKQQAAADMFTGLDPHTQHLLKQGQFDSGVKLREGLKKDGIDVADLAQRVSEGNASLKADYQNIFDAKQPEEAGNVGESLASDLKANPDKVFSKEEFSKEIKDSLGDSPLDHQTYEDAIPDKINKSLRMDQENILKDFNSGKILEKGLPKDIKERIRSENNLQKFRVKLAESKRLFSKFGDDESKDLISHYKTAIKEEKANQKPLLKPEQETRNIKSILFDEDGSPKKGWEGKKVVVNRLKELSKVNNLARNAYAQLHFSSDMKMKSLYKDSRDNAIANHFYDMTVMKSLHEKINDLADPVNKKDMEEFGNHLKGSGIGNVNYKLPGTDEITPIREQLNEHSIDEVDKMLDNLKDSDLRDQLKEASRKVERIPAYNSMAKALAECAKRIT